MIGVAGLASGNWYDDWGRKVVITVDHDASGDVCASGTLTNYPILVTEDTVDSEMLDSDDGDYASNKAQDDCGDLRVYGGDYSASNPATEDTDRMAIEVVTCTHGSSPTLQLWVEMDTFNCTADTVFTIYFNATGKSQPAQSGDYGQHATWSAYTAVYHMEESSSTVYNSASDSHDLSTSNGTPTYQQTGQIGYSILFDDGSSEYFEVSSNALGQSNEPVTISAWAYSDSDSEAQTIAGVYDASTESRFMSYRQEDPSNRHDCFAVDSSGASQQIGLSSGFNSSSWYALGCRFTTSSARTSYIDGSGGTEDTGYADVSGLDTTTIGATGDVSRGAYFSGYIDEVRFAVGDLGATWLEADANIQNAPATWVIEGSPSAP
jgi:hypothetical protein